MKYVALLRGINVGGNKKVPMGDLKKAMEKGKMKDVKTLLNSGNVVFESDEKEAAVNKHLETLIETRFGFPVPVILRTFSAIEKLANADPFKGISVTEATRLYVSFLGEKPKSSLKKYESPDGNFRILKVSGQEIISVLTVTADRGSVDAMTILEKEFGKNITTRNWNTVLKLLKTKA